jgi:hypothetical protein
MLTAKYLLERDRVGNTVEARRDEGSGRNPSGFSLRDFRIGKKGKGDRFAALFWFMELGCFLGFGGGLRIFFCLRLKSKLLFHFEGDSIGIYLVG